MVHKIVKELYLNDCAYELRDMDFTGLQPYFNLGEGGDLRNALLGQLDQAQALSQ